MNGSSASSIVELSRRRSRYRDQDALLRGFVGNHGMTAKEVAVEVLDWKYEQYANAPKRAFDLVRLGYLELLEQKVCKHTGKEAHSYRITEKGVAHLRKDGLLRNDDVIDLPTKVASATDVGSRFSELRDILGDR